MASARLMRFIPLLIVLAALFMMSAQAAPASTGDPVRGKTLYESRCFGCHSIDADRIGPRHRGVVGRKAGSIVDFDYSPALKKVKFVWTPKQLDKWLQGPGKLVKGTRMAFTVPVAADRTAIIAYLATQK
jgi:cytochrome c